MTHQIRFVMETTIQDQEEVKNIFYHRLLTKEGNGNNY